MALEATVICIDNSEWMRNGDFGPSRFEAQQDACVSICGVKTRLNPENSVGLISTAGKAIEVCVPLTQDPGKVIAALHKVKISGDANFVGAIRVAQLALRHRQKTGRKQEQRVVLFVGSPIIADKQELEDIGKQLKKNSVAIDIISFGEPNAVENEELLQILLNAANNKDESGKDNSHLVPISTGNNGNLSDVLGQMNGDMPGAPSSAEFLDPELLWAMELSKQTFAEETKQSKPDEPTVEKDTVMKDNNNPEDVNAGSNDDSELQAALRLSLQGDGGPDIDQELAMVIELSQATALEDIKRDETTKKEEKVEKKEEKKEEKPEVKKENKKEEKQETKKEDTTNMEVDPMAMDPSFLASVVLDLPNVDINDPEVQSILNSLNKEKDSEKK